MEIHVLFVDASTGQPFAQTALPTAQLPDTFEVDTTLHLGDDDWHVERADPPTRAEFERAGQLRLTLRRVEQVSPQDILFSVPTLCDVLPPADDRPGAGGGRLFRLHEDLWRDVELVATEQQADVDENFAAIRRVYETAAVPGRGFRELHVRKTPAAPLAGRQLTLEAVAAAFGQGVTVLDGVHLQGHPGPVLDGFALRTATGLVLYGTTADGLVTVLGLDTRELAGAGADGGADPGALAALMTRASLTLVDWSICAQLGDADGIAAWLAAGGSGER